MNATFITTCFGAVLATTAAWAQSCGPIAVSQPTCRVSRGSGDCVRAAGEYNYQTSLANINNEHAYRLHLENKIEAVKTYFEMRKLNTAYRAAEEGPPLSAEQIKKIAHDGVPARLTALEYSRGNVYWPSLLQSDEFAGPREELDRRFAHQYTGGGTTSPSHRETLAAVTEMRSILKAKCNEVTPTEYVAAKKFLDSLAYETRFAPSQSVASN